MALIFIRMKFMFVYIVASQSGVIYVGVTNNLCRRVREHRSKVTWGFTAKYNVNRLVYFETFESPLEAIWREKQIKRWRREKKVGLINRENPRWQDLWEELCT
jgi:putative endonuclease